MREDPKSSRPKEHSYYLSLSKFAFWLRVKKGSNYKTDTKPETSNGNLDGVKNNVSKVELFIIVKYFPKPLKG